MYLNSNRYISVIIYISNFKNSKMVFKMFLKNKKCENL